MHGIMLALPTALRDLITEEVLNYLFFCFDNF
jgi:hypothetical protein